MTTPPIAIVVYEGHGPVLLRVYSATGPQPTVTVPLTPDQAIALAHELLGHTREARVVDAREAPR